MNNLPLNLQTELDEIQKGALACKEAISEMVKHLDSVEFAEDEKLGEILLRKRSLAISRIVSHLGDLTPYNLGFISSLLELGEVCISGGVIAGEWQPSLISGDWQ